MAFYNYVLIAALILLIGFRIVSAKRKLIAGWINRVVNVISTIAIILILCLVVLFPGLKSIPATGEYSYASCVLELTDTSRTEEYKTDGSLRKLSVQIYYPHGEGISENTCPLIVFSHGGISTKTSNLSLYKELASHGYVVASIDHTYHSLYTEIDGDRIYIDSGYLRELKEEDSHSDIENSYAYFQKWMKLRTDDINFVINTLIDKSIDISSIGRLIDKNRIGVAGHSLGGSAALGVARQRGDVKAVLAMEAPYLCDITGVDGNEFIWNTNPYRCAVMNIYSDSGYPLIGTDNKYVQNKNHLLNNANIRYCYIEGSNHYTLTDLVRLSPVLCVLLGGRYEKSGYDTLEIINQKSLEFFNDYLK